MNNKIITVLVLTLALFVVGTHNANAASENNTFVKSVMDRLNFNNKLDTQNPSNPTGQGRQEEMMEKFEKRLDSLVQEGRLTNEQKDKILELKTKHFNSVKDLSFAERKALRMEHREEMKKLLQDIGLEQGFLQLGKHGMYQGQRMGQGQGQGQERMDYRQDRMNNK